ncbi:conserved hypothetical protein [Methylobacterium sp. 4-46]|uniref:DUF4188 domain-containing protein n=1 Tax=unclassified Methylobacterium TaxID=2615210 RepID=UPI000152D873|nr:MULTISPECIES: DUF4188 domain-containing protein [Methylobacterium]ACA19821.1 conserved hypothetical protein [Methylobacterium sp. 4-46]WFT79006.1 DUF4188 domain-containing protein [Methylobacterium nodulans]
MIGRPDTGRVPDFSGYPDLVVMYLGMHVRALFGLKTLLGLGPAIEKAGLGRPDGLLHYENNIIYGFFPLHVGMRWYWRDMESLERFAKSEPHRTWWMNFLKDSGGTAIWHETYHMRGGMEAIYSDPRATGFSAFLPLQQARGSLRSRHQAYGQADLGHLPAENPPDVQPAT